MSDIRKGILARVYIMYALMCVFALAIIGRVFQLQFVEGDYWREKADSITLAYRTIEPSRGNIFSSDGSLLATSVPFYDLRMDMKSDGITKELFNEKVDSLALCLSGLFKDKSKEEYKRMLREARRDGERYFLLKRNVSYAELKKVKAFPIINKGRYKGGLIVEQKNMRQKPFKELASRTIGFKVGNVTPVGIEGGFDESLRGESGRRLMQKISGNIWMPVNIDNEIEAKDGSDVYTTIDLNIQDVAQQSLYNQLVKNNAEAGCAVLMEVATGEIKAIVNLSRVDSGYYREDFNYAIGYSTEPGSTFKLASMMAGIEDGYIDLEDTLDATNGRTSYAPGIIMRDSHEGLQEITAKHAFEVSSNVGVSKLIYKYYRKNPQQFIDRINKMSFGKKLNLQIEGEGTPRIKSTKDKDWSKISLPYISIGYESTVTPLHTLTFYNAVANNGKMVKPLFVKEIKYRGKTIQSFNTSIIADSICSSRTIAKAKELLEGVVINGTGKKLKECLYSVAGKTGTAQMANSKGGYKSGKIKYQASFCGYFPADKPAYSCIVVVYNPSVAGYYGGEVALPVFKDIADKVYATNLEMHKELDVQLANIPLAKPGNAKATIAACNKASVPVKTLGETGKWAAAEKRETTETLKDLQVKNGVVPNVTGMGLRDAIYLLESSGLQVKVSGRGAVNKQSVPPGTKISKGQLITIELS
ncbi:MAG: transpeptidase family protein [Bacteroidetes bacterium]|jgi:cell division protein FtsI (penicillin-binding protein 3)|nr:transpeptidase family protein [Bacteroidota bacterium]